MNNPFETIIKRLDALDVKIEEMRIVHQKLEPSKDENDLLTVDEAAEFLKLKKQTIYTLASKRKIPHMKRSKRLYFSKKRLLKYLEAGGYKTVDEIENGVHTYTSDRKIRK